jgi:hypothetical protein
VLSELGNNANVNQQVLQANEMFSEQRNALIAQIEAIKRKIAENN